MTRFLANLGLSVQFGVPIAPHNYNLGYTYDLNQWLYEYPFEDRINGYSHSIRADGGFESATITIASGWSAGEIDDWMNYGLGRHVRVANNNGMLVWEGFVNKVIVNRGSYSVARGPLMEIGNIVLVTYTPILDITVQPPTTGESTITPLAIDEDSIEVYGYIEKHLAGGQLIDADTYGTYTNQALELRDVFLQESKDPQLDQTINFTSPAEPTITLECRGYYDWMGTTVYNDCDALSLTSYVEISTKIWEVVWSDINDLFVTTDDPDSIEYNPLLTMLGDCEDRTAKTIIEELVSLGDAFDNRWLFYVDEERVCRYHKIPDTIEYKIRITDRDHVVETIFGDRVYPWDVRPGKWASMDDFLTAGVPANPTSVYFPSTNVNALYFRTDPKNMFIESVQFTAPDTLTLTGGRIGRLSQRMAQLGVGL